MDQERIIDTLGLVTGGGMSITDLQMVQWGRDLILECRYQTVSMDIAPDEPVYFRLIFSDCREIKYRVYAHIGAHEQGQVTATADVAELSLGKGGHRRNANILTNHFGVVISYGEAHVEHGEHRYHLD